MDYEKKYKESMAKMSTFLAKHDGFTISKDGEMYKELSEIFPELKESEDERIRKEIISYIKSSGAVTNKKLIAWLEKQGEQKPAWSEEDGAMLDNIVAWIEGKWGTLGGKVGGREAYISFLKSLKNRVQPQPKQEWSEEDEEIIKNIIAALNKLSENILSYEPLYQKEINWLKSLKERYTWKPSDEQMKALYDSIPEMVMAISEREMLLNSLYKDLKKLREK